MLKKQLVLHEKTIQIIWDCLKDHNYKALDKLLTNAITAKPRKKRKAKEVKVDISTIATTFREDLIKNQTSAEAKFKALLKVNEIEYEFQKIFYFTKGKKLDFYILDFYIPKLNIAIEIDGGYHNQKNQQKLDRERTKVIKENGIYEVVRFTNEEVLESKDTVKDRLVGYKVSKPDTMVVDGKKYKIRKYGNI